ncbi:MAG: VRR-NUC domain-containing protein [Lachnospirales bacterium]
MREKYIEQKLVMAVKQKGGLAPKFTAIGFDGMPDRLILMPSGKMAFVEVKAKGKKPRPLQLRRKRQLEQLGFLSFVLDDPLQIGGVLDGIQST